MTFPETFLARLAGGRVLGVNDGSVPVRWL
jgi:hypothetical protein